MTFSPVPGGTLPDQWPPTPASSAATASLIDASPPKQAWTAVSLTFLLTAILITELLKPFQ